MTRLRSAAQRAPQTTDAATAIAITYSTAAAEIARIEAKRDRAIARANAAADRMLVPLVAQAKDAAKQLKPWWEANFETLTEGKRKSIEIGGCTIGYRITPPKVAFEHGVDKDGVEALLHFGRGDGLLKVPTPTLAKPMILAELQAGAGDDDAVPLELIGFSAEQSEEFFLDVSGPGDAAKPATSL